MSTPEATAAGAVGPGWHPDPTGRFELRYHNGRAWTADVSTDGVRLVDPLGTGATPATNRPATAAMILGIIAVSTGWLPVIAVASLLCALVAIALGIIGRRRARRSGIGARAATAGLATGAAGLVIGALGIAFTVLVFGEVDRYLDPQPNRALITSCRTSGDDVTASGELTNLGDETADFTVRIALVLEGTDNTRRTTSVEIDDVAPGETAAFDATTTVGGVGVDCVVRDVDGPLPFGIDLG